MLLARVSAISSVPIVAILAATIGTPLQGMRPIFTRIRLTSERELTLDCRGTIKISE